MVPYDVPLAAHDMILRFMQVDFAKLSGGSATLVSSKVGDEVKPISAGLEDGKNTTDGATGSGKTNTEQDKAMWEGAFVMCWFWMEFSRAMGRIEWISCLRDPITARRDILQWQGIIVEDSL
jgi:hypothetical protein